MERNLVQRAIEFAKTRHAGQVYGKEHDYMFHLYSVLNIVSEYSEDENVLAAAILHDIIEDTETTYEEIYTGFGCYIADLVFYLSDPVGINRKERKRLLYEQFEALEACNLKSSIALIKYVDRY